jgi:lysophospholipase L1-like esterase
MKNEHKLYAFFSAAAGLASNYLFFSAVYRESGILTAYQPLPVIVWANTAAWALIAFLFYKNRIKTDRIRKILFSFSCLQIFFVLTVLLDRIAGSLLSDKISAASQDRGVFIFPPNTREHFKTTEFEYDININSLGLRDREINQQPSNKTRIFCFGDSWTFGWGVELEKSWPKVMERFLIENKQAVEVINCGRGGQYTTLYKKNAEHLIPLMKPDIVLVGVLQGDDLAQLYENHFPLPAATAKRKIGKEALHFISVFLKDSYKNILVLTTQPFTRRVYNTREDMKKQAKAIVSNFTRLQAIKYQTLDEATRTMFENGDLNPSLINYGMYFPERMVVFNNPEHPATRQAREALKNDIQAIKNLCEQYQCRLIFVNLPSNVFTGHTVIRNSTTDPLFNDYLYKNNHVDAIYQSTAEAANVPYLEMTELFKKLHPKDKYFYLYDGHPTPLGYEVMGRTVGQYLLDNHLLISE